MSGATSRALDRLGLVGAIGSVTLRPLIEGEKVVGPAVTVRNVPSRVTRTYGLSQGLPSFQKGDNEAYFVGKAGDVVVIDCGGLTDRSCMGGSSATIGKARGFAGSVIDGACTGVGTIREVKYPVWCRGGTTLTGHHRIETVEINGTVSCAGVQVQPGDLVVADDTGIAIVPSGQEDKVLSIMRKDSINRAHQMLSAGARPAELGKEIAKMGL